MTAQDWFNSLQVRERYLLIGAAVVITLLVAYLWLVEPLRNDLETLRKSVSGTQSQLLWMQQASVDVQRLQRGQSSARSADTRTSLVMAVERSASGRGLRSDIRRLEPQGSDKISIEMINTDFNQMMAWLGELESGFGAKTIQINSNKTATAGRVDARIILGRTIP